MIPCFGKKLHVFVNMTKMKVHLKGWHSYERAFSVSQRIAMWWILLAFEMMHQMFNAGIRRRVLNQRENGTDFDFANARCFCTMLAALEKALLTL